MIIDRKQRFIALLIGKYGFGLFQTGYPNGKSKGIDIRQAGKKPEMQARHKFFAVCLDGKAWHYYICRRILKASILGCRYFNVINSTLLYDAS